MKVNITLIEEEKPNSQWSEDDEKGLSRFAFYRYADIRDCLFLSNVFVSEDIRGGGIGNDILSVANNVARLVGARSIMLKVKRGSWMQGWYKRHGYFICGDVENENGYAWMRKVLMDDSAVDLEKEIKETFDKDITTLKSFDAYSRLARHFYELGRQSKPEVSEGLEEAARVYSETTPFKFPDQVPAGKRGFIAGAKWQKAQSEKELSEKIASAYQLGLADKEKQMMKEAVEVRVQTSPLNGPLGISAYCCNFPSKHPFYRCKAGDKVKLIIIKEDEQ